MVLFQHNSPCVVTSYVCRPAVSLSFDPPTLKYGFTNNELGDCMNLTYVPCGTNALREAGRSRSTAKPNVKMRQLLQTSTGPDVANKTEAQMATFQTYEAPGVTRHLRHPSADKGIESEHYRANTTTSFQNASGSEKQKPKRNVHN
jgi:hypothetical protein